MTPDRAHPSSASAIDIRRLRDGDADEAEGIWRIFHAVVEPGNAFPWTPETTRDEALDAWLHPVNHVFIAREGESIVGSYFLRPVQPGLGSHIANAAYMVAPWARSRGIGRSMGDHSIVEARRRGFRAMQFNFVVSTNDAAVDLWKSLGFSIIGSIPRAYHHRTLGFVAAHIMHLDLTGTLSDR